MLYPLLRLEHLGDKQSKEKVIHGWIVRLFKFWQTGIFWQAATGTELGNDTLGEGLPDSLAFWLVYVGSCNHIIVSALILILQNHRPFSAPAIIVLLTRNALAVPVMLCMKHTYSVTRSL